MSPGVPDDVRELIEQSISSVRQLDLLLLLRQTHGARDWSASELETTLRSSAVAVDNDLAGLLQSGLAEVVPGPPTLWRYRPGPRDATVDRLAGSYRSHRPTVMRLIATSGGSSLDMFADAFRLRRKDDPDG